MFPLIFYGGDIIKKRVLAFVMMMVVAFSCFALPASALGGFIKRDFTEAIKNLNDALNSEEIQAAIENDFLELLTSKMSSQFNVDLSTSSKVVFLADPYYESSNGAIFLGRCLFFDNVSPDLVTANGSTLSWSGNCHAYWSCIYYRPKDDCLAFQNYGEASTRTSSGIEVIRDYLLYTDISIAFGDDIVKPDAGIKWNISTDSDAYTATVTASSDSEEASHIEVKLYDQSGDKPGNSRLIPYQELYNSRSDFSENNPYTYTFSLRDFMDTCQDKKNYSTKIYIEVIIEGYDGRLYDDFLAVDLNELGDLDSDDDLFKEKKDYYDFPDIEDYLEDVPDPPEWDPEHPLDSIWNIVKWVGRCVVTIVHNIKGLLRWLKDSFIVFLKNIGVALYNLVYDIRRLLSWFFIPKSKNIESIVKKKFPSFDKVIKAFNDVKNGKYAPISFTLLGNDVTFDLLSISSQLRNGLYTASTIVIRVVELFAVIKCVFKAFGVNPSGGEEEGS